MGSRVSEAVIDAVRAKALEPSEVRPAQASGQDLFGSLVFNDTEQQARLPKPVYHALRRTITHGEGLDGSVADTVARAMKD
ncbi:MAG: glutamine synthetase type III, partial [Luteitalea sp.]|nr:glutamine synthetase type III [Luteitalea sp.]